MTSALATQAKYPFGLRDAKLYPFTDQNGTALADEGFDLPAVQTFSFADNEDYTNLRGDDELLAVHGNGAQVNWSLEAGGISLQAWAILTGGQIIEAGVAPNRTVTLRKCSDDVRPYFQVRGLSMNDNQGDTVAIVYRAKCNGDIKGQFGDGAFFVTSADGIGLPIPGTKLLYDFIQHESATFLSLESTPIPLVPPRNIVAVPLSSTAAIVQWEPVSTYTGYRGQTSIDGGTSWTLIGTNTNEVQTVTQTAAGATLTFDGVGPTSALTQTTGTAAQCQAALEALANIDPGDVSVAGAAGGPFTVTFGGKYADTNVPLMTATGATVAATTQGASGDVTDPEFDLSGLAPNTDYLIRIAGKIGTDVGNYGVPVPFSTPA